MPRFDLSTPAGRFHAGWDYFWSDHAFLRLAFSNAHWLGPDLVRTNQPSPRRLMTVFTPRSAQPFNCRGEG